MATQLQQTKLVPLPILGTDYVVEQDPSGRFMQDRRKTFLQNLYNDNFNPNSAVLPPSPVRSLWELLQNPNLDPKVFYTEQLHKPYGIKPEDLEPAIRQLEEEMHGYYPFVNGALVVANNNGMVLNLGNTQLPAFVSPIGVYTAKPVLPKDEEHGMTLEEFKGAGGRIVAYNAFPANQYGELKDREWVKLPRGIKPLGAIEGDKIYANLDPSHSDGSKALGWLLFRADEGPSDLNAGVRLGYWFSDGGVLRGRRLNAAIGYQERMLETANHLERLAINLRTGL